MDNVRDKLTRLLDFLARTRLGLRGEKADKLHRAALDYEKVDRLPVVFSYPFPEESRFQPHPNGAIYKNPAAMLYNELLSAWGTSIALGESVGDDLPPTIRPNWGTVLVASVLGGQAEQGEDNTPWIRRNDDRPISLEEIADADPYLPSAGWIPRVLETYGAYRELLEPYPELTSALRITLPDLQGPLDTAEQLLGADLFIDMLERPELAARAFLRTAELQVACARLLLPFVHDGPDGYAHQHGFMIKGGILIRCDSAVMISPELYLELVAPADEHVLSAFCGGGIHSCGRIGHAVPAMLGLESIRCFDFGQSYMNEVDALYDLARQRNVPLLRVQPTVEELETGTILERFPTGVTLRYEARSLEDAIAIYGKYVSDSALRKQHVREFEQ